ncbi:hypothetical protein WA171_006800 [Blastocystis sp. BT1]
MKVKQSLTWICYFLFLLSLSFAVNVCSREGSLEVQKLIEKYISPVIEYYEYSLPSTCPLKIDRSRYYLENLYKEKLDSGYYRCGKCGKVFVHEYYLLLHNERKHPQFTDESTVCLDKYKNVFDGVTMKHIDCRNPQVQRSLILCQKTLMSCFPTDESDFDLDLYKYMYRSLCSPLLCEKNSQEQTEEYVPVAMTAIALPVVIVVVIFLTVVLYLYKKFSVPKDDLRVFSKLD